MADSQEGAPDTCLPVLRLDEQVLDGEYARGECRQVDRAVGHRADDAAAAFRDKGDELRRGAEAVAQPVARGGAQHAFVPFRSRELLLQAEKRFDIRGAGQAHLERWRSQSSLHGRFCRSMEGSFSMVSRA